MNATSLEAAGWSNKPAIVMIWDMSQFYDSVQIPRLVSEGLKWQVPPAPLCISLLVHLAPRAMRIDKAVSSPIHGMGRSLVAGDGSSTSLARAVLLSPVLDSIQAGADSEAKQQKQPGNQSPGSMSTTSVNWSWERLKRIRWQWLPQWAAVPLTQPPELVSRSQPNQLL